jgi:hypothetical protein
LPIIAIALLIALVLSGIVTFVLEYIESTQIEQISSITTITISNETRFGAPSQNLIKKGYFDSVGEVFVYLSSPYAKYWQTFNVWMSLDNASWITVPFLESATGNLTQMANLGSISFGDPQLTIYLKYYVPPQTVVFPPNVTKQDASNLTSNVVVKRRPTPADATQWTLVFFAVFGVVFSVIGVILDLLISGKNSKSSTKNVGKGIKKKSRVKAGRKNLRLLGFLSSNLSGTD